VFCGRPWGRAGKSAEHALPRWMRKQEMDLLTRPQLAYSAGFRLRDVALLQACDRAAPASTAKQVATGIDLPDVHEARGAPNSRTRQRPVADA
jgi:hypothetical protein